MLNAGAGGNVSGFRLTEHGNLKPIAGSTRALPSVDAGPAQVAITPDGDGLVVTEKNTNTIDTFPLRHDDRPVPARPIRRTASRRSVSRSVPVTP